MKKTHPPRPLSGPGLPFSLHKGMHMGLHVSLLMCLLTGPLAASTASAQTPAPTPPQELRMDSISRPAPRKIPDLLIKGRRYSQVLNPAKLGLSGQGGWLLASDAASGERCWTLRVYEPRINPADESDVQELFFRSMEQLKGRHALRIVNEAGQAFIVDLETQAVSPER